MKDNSKSRSVSAPQFFSVALLASLGWIRGSRQAPSRDRKRLRGFPIVAWCATALLLAAVPARADYVGSSTNRIFLDPDAMADILDGYDNGDLLSYIMETSPADTGSTNGHAAWQTLYVPEGVEVIGVEYVTASGGSFIAVPAVDTDQTYAGWGQRGAHGYGPTTGVARLADGYVNEVQQDTGVFYSTDSRTRTTTSQILPTITPTGPQTKPAVIFNQWDYDQVHAFGEQTNALAHQGLPRIGQGNTPLISVDSGSTWAGTGSPVAGSGARYANDYNPACNGAASCSGTAAQCALVADLQCVGPWTRIAYSNAKFGGSGAITPASAIGAITNTSVATAAGVTVSAGSPLPETFAASGTNAVRWVHGQRTLGDIELSRVRFRITNVTAFLASFTDDTFCLESTGGDTSDTAAKDNNWRYYEPKHRCYQALGGPDSDGVLLKQFTHADLSPSSGAFLETGDVVGFEVTFTNTSGATLTSVTLTDTADTPAFLDLIEPGNAKCPYPSYDGDIPGPAYTAGSATLGTAAWGVIPSMAAGTSVTVHLCATVLGVVEGDVVSNTADVTYVRADLSAGAQSSTATGTAGYGRIAGTVFFDTDNDGDGLDGDNGIEGVTVELWNDNNNNGTVDGGDTLRGTFVTLSDGSYEFLTVPAGNYVVRETNPAGLASSGDKDTLHANCGSGNGCDQIDVTMTATSNSIGNDFFDACTVDADCDDGLFCNGAETCSANVCTASTNPCSGGDVCGNVCNETADNCFVAAGTTCRADAGECDVAETCTGSSAACPADGFEAAGTACGSSSDTVCDNPDTCNAGGTCLANNEPAATVCRAGAGTCDVAENCDGAGACPSDGFVAAGTTCRADAGECDVAETCTGSSAACPADGFEAAGTACGSSSDTVCDNPDTCNASGTCLANNEPAATPCDDLLFCNGSDACSGGSCVHSGDPCLGAGCDEVNDICPIPSSGADLSIDKLDDGVAQTGGYLTYSLMVTNNGPDAANSVTVTDTLDPNTTFVTSMAACVEAPAGTLTCSLGTLASGSSTSFVVVVWVDPAAPTAGTATGPACGVGEDLCNVASVSSITSDPTPGNNTVELASDVVVATTFSAVSIVVTDLEPEPLLPGIVVTYEITVTNLGPDDATDTVVYDTLGLYLTYVGDTGGCSVQTGTDGVDRLACPIGTLAALSSITFQVQATIGLAAPINFTIADGDCTGVEDLCDGAVAATRSSDADPADNFDSEPTDASANLNCNDGILDPGEECEPPDVEACNNGIDDDGDFLVDCADPDCAIPGFQSCDANCLLTTACLPILNDPAIIRSYDEEGRSAGRRGFVKLHGRFIPETPSDPVLEGFVFSLGNANGEFFRTRLLPNDLQGRSAAGSGGRYVFKDRTAKHGPGLRQGMYLLKVRTRIIDGYLNYAFRILAYGDMSRANRSRMTTQVYVGDDVAYLTADWSGGPGKWKLSLADAY